MCTTLFDGTVVKLGFVVRGVAPGSVVVTVRVAAVVFCQIGIWMRPRVYPGKITLKHYKLHVMKTRFFAICDSKSLFFLSAGSILKFNSLLMVDMQSRYEASNCFYFS